MKKLFLVFLSLMFISLLVAETMTIHMANGEIVEFELTDVDEITFDSTLSVEEMVKVISQIPIKFLKNYPNPFNPETTIQFELGEDGYTAIEIYNAKGQRVRTILSEFLSLGLHSAVWNGLDSNGKRVSSGIYFYQIMCNNETKTKKMIMVK